MYADEVNAKTKAEKQYLNNANNCEPVPMVDRDAVQGIQGMAGTAQTKSRSGYSLRDEAAKQAQYHQEKAVSSEKAAIFLSQHPEFEEFIRLVRSGALQF